MMSFKDVLLCVGMSPVCMNRRNCSGTPTPTPSQSSRRLALPEMPQTLHSSMQSLQPKRAPIEEDDRIHVFAILTVALKRHFGLPRLVVRKFHRHLVLHALVQHPGTARVNGSRLEFIYKSQHPTCQPRTQTPISFSLFPGC